MNGLFHDIRYALRQLRKNPGFACTAIVILGLGIGASTAIFSAVNPILFKPLPYPRASRIMMIWYAGENGSRYPQAFHTYRELVERNRSFDAIAGSIDGMFDFDDAPRHDRLFLNPDTGTPQLGI